MLSKLGNTLMTNWLAGWHGNGHGADVTCDKVTPLPFNSLNPKIPSNSNLRGTWDSGTISSTRTAPYGSQTPSNAQLPSIPTLISTRKCSMSTTHRLSSTGSQGQEAAVLSRLKTLQVASTLSPSVMRKSPSPTTWSWIQTMTRIRWFTLVTVRTPSCGSCPESQLWIRDCWKIWKPKLSVDFPISTGASSGQTFRAILFALAPTDF